MTTELQVKWERHRYLVEFPTEKFAKVTVRDLKEKCHRFTGIDPANMKLLAYGGMYFFHYACRNLCGPNIEYHLALMKDENKTLSSYGLSAGSKVILMASKSTVRYLCVKKAFAIQAKKEILFRKRCATDFSLKLKTR